MIKMLRPNFGDDHEQDNNDAPDVHLDPAIHVFGALQAAAPPIVQNPVLTDAFLAESNGINAEVLESFAHANDHALYHAVSLIAKLPAFTNNDHSLVMSVVFEQYHRRMYHPNPNGEFGKAWVLHGFHFDLLENHDKDEKTIGLNSFCY
jgi:hypothetical protein